MVRHATLPAPRRSRRATRASGAARSPGGNADPFRRRSTTRAGSIPGGFILDHRADPGRHGDRRGHDRDRRRAAPGFSSAAFGLTALDSGDFETADQTDQLAGAQVRISAGFGTSPGSNEQLTINGTTAGVLGSGIAYSYNSGTGVMTLTGIDSFADYEAALALVAYSIDGDNPDNYGASTSRNPFLFGVRRAAAERRI